MIRILLDRAFDNERHYIHAVGLSTDTKPTTGIITGSKFVAVDTGAAYLFDETAGEWNENQQLTAAVAAYLEDHPEAIDQAAIEAMFGDQLDGIEDDISGLKSAINGQMLLDTSNILPAYPSGNIGERVSFVDSSSTKTIINIINVTKGLEYTVNVEYGETVSSENSRNSMIVDKNKIIKQKISTPVEANKIKTIVFTATDDGYMVLALDANYLSVKIDSIGIQSNIKILDSKIDNSNFPYLAKAKLIVCFKAVAWVINTGKELLLKLCKSFGVNGWIDVKPNTTINETTGEPQNNSDGTRQVSDYIDVHGFASFRGFLNDELEYPIWYNVKCYDSNKEYIGTATKNNGNTATANGNNKRTFINGTYYIRLLITPDTNLYPLQDLSGVYTGRMLEMNLFDSSENETIKRFALTEVEDFSNDI